VGREEEEKEKEKEKEEEEEEEGGRGAVRQRGLAAAVGRQWDLTAVGGLADARVRCRASSPLPRRAGSPAARGLQQRAAMGAI
jgi:hypothetical protein